MNFNLLVQFLDGTEKTVSVKAADVVAFEERFDLSMASLEKNMRMTHMFFMAWSALRRDGEKKSFEDWLNLVDMVQAADSPK
jgi:hypothetical protein